MPKKQTLNYGKSVKYLHAKRGKCASIVHEKCNGQSNAIKKKEVNIQAKKILPISCTNGQNKSGEPLPVRKVKVVYATYQRRRGPHSHRNKSYARIDSNKKGFDEGNNG